MAIRKFTLYLYVKSNQNSFKFGAWVKVKREVMCGKKNSLKEVYISWCVPAGTKAYPNLLQSMVQPRNGFSDLKYLHLLEKGQSV